jgi:hypothetical protein
MECTCSVLIGIVPGMTIERILKENMYHVVV